MEAHGEEPGEDLVELLRELLWESGALWLPRRRDCGVGGLWLPGGLFCGGTWPVEQSSTDAFSLMPLGPPSRRHVTGVRITLAGIPTAAGGCAAAARELTQSQSQFY